MGKYFFADDFNFKGEDELNLVYVSINKSKINLSLSEKFLKIFLVLNKIIIN